MYDISHVPDEAIKGAVLLRYLTSSTGSLSVEELNEAVTQLYEEGGDLMATIAEKWLEQGIEKGIQKGKLEKAFETARKMMKKGFDLDTVLEITGLDKKQIEKLA